MGFKMLIKSSRMLFVDEDGWHAWGHMSARIPAPPPHQEMHDVIMAHKLHVPTGSGRLEKTTFQ